MAAIPPVDLDDLSVAHAARAVRDVVTSAALEVAYTSVGLGLLAYQRFQTRRREIEREARRSS